MKWIIFLFLILSTPVYGAVTLAGDADQINLKTNTGDSDNTWISAWVKLENNSANQQVWARGRDGAGLGWSLYLVWMNSSNKFQCGTVQNAPVVGRTVDSSTTVDDTTTWTHVGCKFRASDEIQIYINGEAENSTGHTNALRSSSEGIMVGRLNGDFGNVSVDEFTVITFTGNDPGDGLWKNLASRVRGTPLQYDVSPFTLHSYLPLDNFSDGTNLDTSTDGYIDRSANANPGTGVDSDNDSSNLAGKILSYQP